MVNIWRLNYGIITLLAMGSLYIHVVVWGVEKLAFE